MSPRAYKEFPANETCGFCGTAVVDPVFLGAIHRISDVFVHYLCMLLSSKIIQRGKDKEGLLGFLAPDIKKEIKRGSKITCTYCRKKGATIECNNKKCSVSFHLPCGLEKGSFHQFYDSFESFCSKHKPRQKIPDVYKTLRDIDCVICSCPIDISTEESLLPKCCSPMVLLHKKCIQMLASYQGYDTRCPLCLDEETFCAEMKKCGIYIPEVDTTYELERREILESQRIKKQCTYPNCLCPKGIAHENKLEGNKWFIKNCYTCGTNGMHKVCLEEFMKKRLEEKGNSFESDSENDPQSNSQSDSQSADSEQTRPEKPDETKDEEEKKKKKKPQYHCLLCLEFRRQFREKKEKKKTNPRNDEEEATEAQKNVPSMRPPRFPQRLQLDTASTSRSSEVEIIEISDSTDSDVECLEPETVSFPLPIQRRIKRKRRAARRNPPDCPLLVYSFSLNGQEDIDGDLSFNFDLNNLIQEENPTEIYDGPSTSTGIRRPELPIPKMSQEVISISDTDSSDDFDINIPGSVEVFNCPEYSILNQLSSEVVKCQNVKKKGGRYKGRRSKRYTYTRKKKNTVKKITSSTNSNNTPTENSETLVFENDTDNASNPTCQGAESNVADKQPPVSPGSDGAITEISFNLKNHNADDENEINVSNDKEGDSTCQGVESNAADKHQPPIEKISAGPDENDQVVDVNIIDFYNDKENSPPARISLAVQLSGSAHGEDNKSIPTPYFAEEDNHIVIENSDTDKTEAYTVNVSSSEFAETSLFNNHEVIENTDKTEVSTVKVNSSFTSEASLFNNLNVIENNDCLANTDKMEAITENSDTDKTEAYTDNVVSSSEFAETSLFNNHEVIENTDKTEVSTVKVNSSFTSEASLFNNLNVIENNDCLANTDKMEAITVDVIDSSVTSEAFSNNFKVIENISSLDNIDKTEANNVNVVNSSVISEVSLFHNHKIIESNDSLANTDEREANTVNVLCTSDCLTVTDKTEASTVRSSDSLSHTDKTEANAINIVNTFDSSVSIDKAEASAVNSSVVCETSLLNNKGIENNCSLANIDEMEANTVNFVNVPVSLANIDKVEANIVNDVNTSVSLANIDKMEVNVVNSSVISEASLLNNHKGIKSNCSLANIDETEANPVNVVSSSDNLANTVNINRSQALSVDINDQFFETKFVEHSTETCIIGNTCSKQQGEEVTVTEKKSIDYSKEIGFNNSPYKNVNNLTTCDKTLKNCVEFKSDALLEQKNSNKRKYHNSRHSTYSKRRKLSTIQLESNNKEIESRSWINKSIPVDISPKVSSLNNALLSTDDNKGAAFDQSTNNLSTCQKHVSDKTLTCSFLSSEHHNAEISDKSSLVKSDISVETVDHEIFSNLEERRVKKSENSNENLFENCQTETGNLLSTFNKLDSLLSSTPEKSNPGEASKYENETIDCTPVDNDLCKVTEFPWYICCSTPCSSCTNSKSHLENSFQSNSEESEILNNDAQFNNHRLAESDSEEFSGIIKTQGTDKGKGHSVRKVALATEQENVVDNILPCSDTVDINSGLCEGHLDNYFKDFKCENDLAEINNKSNILCSDNDLQQVMNSSETSSKDRNQKSADSVDSTLNTLSQPFCLPENTSHGSLHSSMEYSQNNPENYTNKTDDIELNKREHATCQHDSESTFNNYPESSKSLRKQRDSSYPREVVVEIPKGSNLVNLDSKQAVNISCISSSEITSTKNDDCHYSETYKTATHFNLNNELNNDCSMVSSTVHLDSSPINKGYEKSTVQVVGNKKFSPNVWHDRRQMPPDWNFPGLIKVYVHYENGNAPLNSYTNRNHGRNRPKTPLLPCVEILNPDKRSLLKHYICKTFLYKQENNIIIYTDSPGFRYGQLFIQNIPHYIDRRVVFESGCDLESYLQLILENVKEYKKLDKPYMILIVCAGPNVPRTENVFNLLQSITKIKNLSLTVTTLLHSNNVEVRNFNKKLCDLSRIHYYQVWDINKILFKYP